MMDILFLKKAIYIFFCFFSPTLAFVSVNPEFFSAVQIRNALGLIATVALLFGIGAALFSLPPLLVCVVGLVCFFALSERSVMEMLPSLRLRCGVVIGILALFLLMTHFVSLWGCTLLLALYTALAAFDLKKNIGKPKRDVFSPFQTASAFRKHTQNAYSHVNIQKKPNIFFFYLESMHSSKAMQKLYASDDYGLDDYLQQQGFTVYDTLSSETSTACSIYSLLHMRHFSDTEIAAPSVLRILKQNGYTLRCYDCSSYVFAGYAAYMDEVNFTIPEYVATLYGLLMPVFAQSRVVRILTKGFDPFATGINFTQICNEVRRDLSLLGQDPHCFVIRFGANHAPLQARWDTLGDFPDTYKKYYADAVTDLKKMTSVILAADPDALIVAAGDHGAFRYQNIWEGAADPNTMIRSRGLEPALVALDYSAVLLAIRWPGSLSVTQPIHSYVNLFRILFTALGGEGEVLNTLEPDITLLRQTQTVPFLIAQDGIPLEDWQYYTPKESYENLLRTANDQPDNVDVALLLAEALVHQGRIPEAAAHLQAFIRRPAHARNPPLVLLQRLGRYLLRIGLAKQSEAVLLAAYAREPDDGDVASGILWSLIMQQKYEAGYTFLADMSKQGVFDEHERLAHSVKLHKAEHKLVDAQADVLKKIELYENVVLSSKTFFAKQDDMVDLCVLFDSTGETEKALCLLRNQIALFSTGRIDVTFACMMCLALLTLRAKNWKKSEEDIQFCIKNTHTVLVYPVFYLLLAGSLEMQGRIHEALGVLLQLIKKAGSPNLIDQLGLFCIRHKIHDAQWVDIRRGAYKSLHEKETAIQQSGLFDEHWYLSEYADIMQSMSPIRHYIHFGQMLVLDPNPYFNTAFYYLTQHDMRSAAHDPLLHYCYCSPYENRDPSLKFSTLAYLTQHPELAETEENTLAHFLRERQHQQQENTNGD